MMAGILIQWHFQFAVNFWWVVMAASLLVVASVIFISFFNRYKFFFCFRRSPYFSFSFSWRQVMWGSGSFELKQRLQNLIFPEGLTIESMMFTIIGISLFIY